jgi:hypothetical protein
MDYRVYNRFYKGFIPYKTGEGAAIGAVMRAKASEHASAIVVEKPGCNVLGLRFVRPDGTVVGGNRVVRL